MRSWGLFLISLFFSHKLWAHQVCDIYLKKHRELACAPNHYLTDFGYRYCRAFQEKRFQFSPKGREVLAKLRQCLALAVEQNQSLTCQNTRDFALRSHVRCYLSEGYCGLSVLDKLRLIHVVRRETQDPHLQKLYQEIRRGCGTLL